MKVPEKQRHPRGRPLQPRFLKEHHHRRATDDSLDAKKTQAVNVTCLEIEWVKGGKSEGKGLVCHLIAANQLLRVSCIPDRV
jgi:hypothetical protein